MIGTAGIIQAVEGKPLPPLQEGESLPITEVDLKQVDLLAQPFSILELHGAGGMTSLWSLSVCYM